ncbi:MAG: hypothetical protein C0393_07875 [Anaerolinea sp.]|nr:hypothetical protein [Anaerolinea sp.]
MHFQRGNVTTKFTVGVEFFVNKMMPQIWNANVVHHLFEQFFGQETVGFVVINLVDKINNNA